MNGFLLDTNCFIQIVRQRPDAPQVVSLLAGVSPDRLHLTDYTLHSIGVIMRRFKQLQGYMAFLSGFSLGKGIRLVTVPVAQLDQVVTTSMTYNLDFDDAHQYAAAELHNLTLASLDADFDRTPRGRLTPAVALARYAAGQGTP